MSIPAGGIVLTSATQRSHITLAQSAEESLLSAMCAFPPGKLRHTTADLGERGGGPLRRGESVLHDMSVPTKGLCQVSVA